ncbi:hypothetical protein CJ030_MR7G001340 [Morella rubra]|uniref:Uncharacterized protein n=1 Tax=Morella rubra TaxID=262757 RepID=A0A6A1V6R6_9ROSI|nr:hypothetical protein CJ030_MR7G001340 [Morella rubra]
MEGLIPYLIRVVKKQRPQNSYRCLSQSQGSSRSYHLLVNAPDSTNGSSHRRTLSEFQPPAVEFIEQRSGLEHIRRRTVGNNSPSASSMGSGPKSGSYPFHVSKEAHNFH